MQSESGTIRLEDFTFCYLYGFAGGNPAARSTDTQRWMELYKLVVGERGGVVLGGSFHPYQLINAKGVPVWYFPYALEQADNGKLETLGTTARGSCLVVDATDLYREFRVWPDNRLDPSVNSAYSRYVPFVIPFLIWGAGDQLRWDREIQTRMEHGRKAGAYAESVTDAIRFLLPSPAFVLGFDSFDPVAPSTMIEHFEGARKSIEGA